MDIRGTEDCSVGACPIESRRSPSSTRIGLSVTVAVIKTSDNASNASWSEYLVQAKITDEAITETLIPTLKLSIKMPDLR